MSMSTYDLSALAACGSMSLIAVAQGPEQAFQTLPVISGLAGAIVACDRASKPPKIGKTIFQFVPVSSAIAGAATAVFAAPFITEYLFNSANIKTAMLVHFVIGLLGASMVDFVLTNADQCY